MFTALLFAFSISVDITGQIDGCTEENKISFAVEYEGAVSYFQKEPVTKTIT